MGQASERCPACGNSGPGAFKEVPGLFGLPGADRTGDEWSATDEVLVVRAHVCRHCGHVHTTSAQQEVGGTPARQS